MDSAAVALFLPGQVVESLETDEEFVGFTQSSGKP